VVVVVAATATTTRSTATIHDPHPPLALRTFQAPPYVIVRKTARGDNHFEGFTVDLLDAVCARISCRYKIYMSEDGIGSKDTGMIGEVHRGVRRFGPLLCRVVQRSAALVPLLIACRRHWLCPGVVIGVSVTTVEQARQRW